MLPSQIADALGIRQDADLFEPARGEEKVPPRKLLDDGVDTQLETALIFLQSRAAAKERDTAVSLREGA
jgi:hypothetical protein